MLSALSDPREDVRRRAVTRILELRTDTKAISEKEAEMKKKEKVLLQDGAVIYKAGVML